MQLQLRSSSVNFRVKDFITATALTLSHKCLKFLNASPTHTRTFPSPLGGVSFMTAWRIPGVASYALCLFFAKLIAYTFLYW